MTPGFAPAKVNLFLHVGPLGSDGYHPLQSWMVFADVGDEVRLLPDGDGLTVDGPFAQSVPSGADNLVLRARDAFLAVSRGPAVGVALTKVLPAASGIGGGSSDAAAVLRLMQLAAPIPEDALSRIAMSLGADVPACLAAQSLIAGGRGEVLFAPPASPPLPAVLVNPGVEVSTAEVFRIFDRQPAGEWPSLSEGAGAGSVAEAVDLVARTRNDLEPAARALAPEIEAVLGALSADKRCRLARMSGSGATCFALTATREAAESLAADLAACNPGWWVKATTLS